MHQGNPHVITAFPAPHAIKGYSQFKPNPTRLVSEDLPLDYIARTQMPAYDHEASWKTEGLRDDFVQKNRLRDIIEAGQLTNLNVYPAFGMSDFKAVPLVWRTRIPEYVKDYVPLNQFM